MNNRALKLSLFSVLFLAIGCSTSSDNLSFSGTWNIAKENGISGESTNALVSVSVLGEKYRIASKDEDSESTEIYDGRTLRRKSALLRSLDPTDPPPAPTVTTESKTDSEVEPRRFWKRSFTGTSMAGGLIAGRETLLYQVQEKTLDGELTMQAWVDAQTKVILKKVFTVYSSQIQQVVSKTKEECVEIKYEPVPDSAFTSF